MSDTTPRPTQTTVAAGTVIVAAALAVVSVGEQLAGINSLETRATVAEVVDQAGAGLDVQTALLGLRVGLMLVAGCATAAVVLGVHVLRRSIRARLGLTLVAVPLFVVGSVTGSFFALLAALSATWLWVEPSRAWLEHRALPAPRQQADPGAGRPDGAPGPTASPWGPPVDRSTDGPTDRPADRPTDRPTDQTTDQLTDQPTDRRPGGPPPHRGEFGAALSQQLSAPPPAYAATAQRPSALVWACVLTWALCSLVAALLGASLTVLSVDPGLMWEELERQNPTLLADSGLTRGDVVRTAYAMLGVGIAWSVLAALLAVLAYRGSNGGRVGLVVCAVLAALLCLVASFGPALLVLPAIACGATAWLLSRHEVRAWFAARAPRPR